MESMSTVAATVRSWASREVVVEPRTRSAVGVIAFALATTFGAQVAVPLPLTPVPVTLQTFFVVLAGVVLGPRLGALSAATYVVVGAAGAPVFANGGAGLPWLLGPTGGYLLAAPPAAMAAGWVAGRRGGTARVLAGLSIGVLTMYAGGIAQLFLLTGDPVARLLAIGVLPFVAGDAFKALLALWITRALRRTSLARI